MAVKCLMTLDSQKLWFCEPVLKEEPGEEMGYFCPLSYSQPGPRRQASRILRDS